jgi:hypothetical protein
MAGERVGRSMPDRIAPLIELAAPSPDRRENLQREGKRGEPSRRSPYSPSPGLLAFPSTEILREVTMANRFQPGRSEAEHVMGDAVRPALG